MSYLRPDAQVSAERAQYIIDSPAQYAQEVLYNLQHNSCEILFELHYFLCEHYELHTNIRYTFIEQGMIDGLVHFALNDGSRYMEDAVNAPPNDLELILSIVFDTLVHLFTLVDEMDPNVIGQYHYSVITLQVTKTIAKEQVALARFLQTIWRRRHDFILGSRYPEDQSLAKAFSTWCSRLCIYCKKQNSRLLGFSYEIFPLLLCCWTRKGAHPNECLRLLETMAFLLCQWDDRGNGDTPLGERGIQELMKHPEEAACVVQFSLWSMNTDVVGHGLQHVLTVVTCLAWLCPKESHEFMRKHWIPLLVAVIRACERQLCSGDDEASCSAVLYTGYLTMFYLRVLAPEGIPFFKASGKRKPVDSDLISLLAHCSPRIVTEVQDSSNFLKLIVDAHRTAATAYVRSRDQTVLPMLLSTAKRCIPATIASLRRITVTSPDVAQRRATLLTTWLRYYCSLGLILGIDVEDIERPPRIAPWLTCASKACFCYGKRPHHKIRVCKGCYQTFYCNTRCQIFDWNNGGHAETCKQKAALI